MVAPTPEMILEAINFRLSKCISCGNDFYVVTPSKKRVKAFCPFCERDTTMIKKPQRVK